MKMGRGRKKRKKGKGKSYHYKRYKMKKRKKGKRRASMGRSSYLKIRPRLKARRRGSRVFLVDSRGRVKGSFRTNKSGAMTRSAAKKRFNRYGTKSSRHADFRKTAKRTYRLRSSKRARKGQAKWFLAPNKYDIQGVDTKMGKKKSRKRSSRRSSSIGRRRSRSM